MGSARKAYQEIQRIREAYNGDPSYDDEVLAAALLEYRPKLSACTGGLAAMSDDFRDAVGVFNGLLDIVGVYFDPGECEPIRIGR